MATIIVKRRKIKWKNVFLLLLFLILIIILIVSVYKITMWKFDSNEVENQLNDIEKKSKIKKVKDGDDIEIINQDVSKDDLYWKYIKMNLIDVDFKQLIHENKDTKGWIQVGGTNINYPFVQATDNEYYLNHSFKKKINSAGWVFLDYRNSINSNDKNTILYAHGRLDKIMFGSLKNILTNGWLKNSNNYIVKLSTEYENTLWQVFSVYKIPTTSDYLKIDFNSDKDFLDFGNMLIKRSQYDFKTSISNKDRILTLSTCYNDSNRVVLHAKLIKRQEKQ